MKFLKLKLSCLGLIISGLMPLTATATTKVNLRTQLVRIVNNNIILANHVCNYIDRWDDWDDYQFCVQHRGWQGHEEQQRQQIPSLEEIVQSCVEKKVGGFADFFQATQQVVQGAYRIASAVCVASVKNDYDTMWINDKRLIQHFVSHSSSFSPAETEQIFKEFAAVYVQSYGWTPPEYR